jgi:hypothetical protein
MVTGRKYFVTLDAKDVECLKLTLSETSDGYHDLLAALDLGNGVMSIRCDLRGAEALLAAARRDCPSAVQAIRTAVVTADEKPASV